MFHVKLVTVIFKGKICGDVDDQKLYLIKLVIIYPERSHRDPGVFSRGLWIDRDVLPVPLISAWVHAGQNCRARKKNSCIQGGENMNEYAPEQIHLISVIFL